MRRRSRRSSTSAPRASAARSPGASNGSGSTPSTSCSSTTRRSTWRRLDSQSRRRGRSRRGWASARTWSGPAVTFVERGDADVVLLAGRYTLLDRSAADELLPLCAERGVELLAAGVFNSGVLAGGTTFDYHAAPPAVFERRRRLDEACVRYEVPLAAAAIQFPLRHPAVTSILVGARTPEEIAEDVRLLDHPVPEELWSELASID